MKFKKIPLEYFPVILDRLSRFEPASNRFKRVFDDIINKFLISDRLKNLPLQDEISIVEEIFNSSLDCNFSHDLIMDTMHYCEGLYFNDIQSSYQYLSARLNLSKAIEKIEINLNSPKNLIWLKNILNSEISDLKYLRKEKSLLFPIERIVLCEGETEHILLDILMKLFGVELDKLGVMVLAAGGKNQVAKKYYEMIEYTKIPFFVLLDCDAARTSELIEAKLRENDEIYIIQRGEFEDLFNFEIIKDTINFIHKNEQNCSLDDFSNDCSMVNNISSIYRKYGFGEYKKAHFASCLKDYIEHNQKTVKEQLKNSEIEAIAMKLCPIVES